MSTTVVPPASSSATEDFDFEKFHKDFSEGREPEHAKPAEPAKEEPKPAEAKAEPEPPKVEEPPKPAEEKKQYQPSRRDRRILIQLGEERAKRAALEARLAALESKGGDPKPAVVEDPEPQRSAYADDATYYRALGRWEGTRGAKEEIAPIKKRLDADEQRRQQEEHLATVRAADQQYKSDIALFEDWDEVASGEGAKFKYTSTVNVEGKEMPSALQILLERSPNRAKLLYYALKEDPEAFREVDAAWADSAKQIEKFREYEAVVTGFYKAMAKRRPVAAVEKKEEPKPAEKPVDKKPTAAELDAAKPRPTESVSVRTPGNAPIPDESITVEGDDTTVNPAFLEKILQGMGARR